MARCGASGPKEAMKLKQRCYNVFSFMLHIEFKRKYIKKIYYDAYKACKFAWHALISVYYSC